MTDRPYRETDKNLMGLIYAMELTPKEVLLLIVDLNERYNGIFEKVHNELSVVIDQQWQQTKEK